MDAAKPIIPNTATAATPLAAPKNADQKALSAQEDAALRDTAREFETVFIAEMLSHAGFDKALSQNAGFGGEAFSSMLVQTYAGQLSDKGGFGLADKIYRQLKDHVS